jgi:hypothetical protein
MMDRQLQIRRDTAANWISNNPTLAAGEFGYETDTGKLKIGDGSTVWNSLDEITFDSVNITNESEGYKIDGTRVLTYIDDHNLFIGPSGNLSLDGGYNTAIGRQSLASITTGNNNTAIGYQCLVNNTEGEDNFGCGMHCLYSNVLGNNNTALGYMALYSNVNASNNTALGTSSLYSSISGNGSVAIGVAALRSNTTGSNNTGIGLDSGYNNTSGNSNIFIGYKAGCNQTTNSNLLIIDNQDRSSAANELTKSLIYGVFDADPANQTLRLNAAVTGINFISNVAIGTSPYACTSTTLNTNLNADLLDGQHASEFQAAGSYLSNVVEDITPQLGGDLDGQSTYDLTNIVDAEFEGTIGVGASPNADYIVYGVKSMSNTTVYGFGGGIINNRNSAFPSNVGGLNFQGTAKPASQTGNRTFTNVFGCRAGAFVETESGCSYTLTATNVYSYKSDIVGTQRGTGQVTLSGTKHFWAANPSLSGGAVITENIAFYDSGMTAGITNWGLYSLTPQSAVCNLYPIADDTYYLGKNDDDSPLAWKGVILKDQTDGKYYRIQLDNGAISIIDLTD